MNAEVTQACERLLSATVNGVYQGIFVTLLTGFALRYLVRTNAATRHAVWFGALLFVTALIPAHLLLFCLPSAEVVAAASKKAPAQAPISPSDSGNGAVSIVVNSAFSPSQLDSSDSPAYPPGAGPQNERAGKTAFAGRAAVATEKPRSHPISALFKPLTSSLEPAVNFPGPACLGLVSVWALLALVRVAVIARRISDLRLIKMTSSAAGDGLQMLFERLRDSLAVRRGVTLRISNAHRSAVVLGFAQPVVLLPAEMDGRANESEAEHVLRHELAHVARRDDWGNLLQQLIQAGLFFHPAVWWIASRLSLEREIACDDFVLEASGGPHAYALTLTNVAARMSQGQHSLAPGVSSNRSQLQQRITMILNMQRDRSPRLAGSRLGFLTAATALFAVLAITAGPRLVLAQSLPTESAESGFAGPAPVVVAPPLISPSGLAGDQSGPAMKPNLFVNPGAPTTPQSNPMGLWAQSAAPVAPVSGYLRAQALAPVQPGEWVASDPNNDSAYSHAGPAPESLTAAASVEDRLDRIEHILQELQAQSGAKMHGAGIANPFGVVRPEVPRMSKDSAAYGLSKPEAKEFKPTVAETQGGANLEALRAARDSLEKSMKALERQIKLLEENQELLKKKVEAGPSVPTGETGPDKPKTR